MSPADSTMLSSIGSQSHRGARESTSLFVSQRRRDASVLIDIGNELACSEYRGIESENAASRAEPTSNSSLPPDATSSVLPS